MSPRLDFLTLPLLVGWVAVAHAAPLSFEQAISLAQQQSPALRADTAQIRAAQLSVIPAGEQPDPKIALGIDNYPVSGMGRWTMNGEPMTMQKVSIMQDFINSDKREARKDGARAAVGVAQAQRRVALLDIRRAVAQGWITRYYLERKVEVLNNIHRENRIAVTTAGAQVTADRLSPSDALEPRIAAADIEDLKDQLTRDISKSKANLRQYIGSAADEPLIGAPPPMEVEIGALREGLDRHPLWDSYDAQARSASAAIREADAEKKPDWGVELGFQRRDPQFGNMVSLQFTWELPIFSSTRQGPRADAKRQDLIRVNAERETARRERSSALESTFSDYEAASRLGHRLATTTLLLARSSVDLQYASYRAGKSSLKQVLAARRLLLDQQLKLIDLQWQQAMLAAELYFSYGELAQ